MKKFSQAIPALHEAEGAAKSDLQKSYAEYFKAKLNKFGAKSPAELTPEQKTEFFNEITKDWTRGEGATKAGQADVEEHGVKESLGIDESAMGDVHIMAQDSKSFADFKKEFVKEFKVEGKDNNKDLDSWLKQVYDSATNESEVNEKTSMVVLDTTDPSDPGLIDYIKAHGIKMAATGAKTEFGNYQFQGARKDLEKMIMDFWDDKGLFSSIKESEVNEGNERLLKQANLSSSEYQIVKKLKGFDEKNWKWDSSKELYAKMDESDVNELKAADLKPGKKYSSPYGEVTFIQINPDGKTMKLHSKETGNVKTDVFNAVSMKLLESQVNEGDEIKSEAEFKEYAMALLKKAHPDDFDEKKANDTVEGILKKCDGDFGACVGILQGSLSEREETQIGTHRYQGKSYPLYTDDEHNHYIKVNGRIIQVDESETNEGECPMCKCDPCKCYTTEGNAFGDAVKKAKDAGEKEFEFQGKTYKVEESEAGTPNDLNEGDLFLPHTNLPTITEEQLKKDIIGNIGNAFNKLLKDAGIKYNPVTAIESGGRIRFESKPLTGNDLGVMKFGFKEVYINTFSGGSMPKIQKGAADENLLFTPYIWFTINYSYKHGSESTNSTGSNGCSLFLPGETSDSIYYDIGSYKFLTASQAAKKSEWK